MCITGDKFKFDKRIVAFVDILGFESKVNNAVDDFNEYEKIKSALNRIYQVKLDNENEGILEKKSLGVEVTTFSDSAVISYPDEGDNLFSLLLNLIHLQLQLVLDGVLIRGGVTVGDLYHDGSIVFGPAMNKAYQYESKIAIYPRIIVDKFAIDHFKQAVDKDEDSLNALMNLLRKDHDGMFYVDMLRQEQELSDYGDEYYEWLCDMRKIIIDGLNNKDDKVIVKYQWLKGYFNSVVTNEKGLYPVPLDMNLKEQKVFRDKYDSLMIDL